MIDIPNRFPQYCELVTNFWLHEPLNAVTNFGFIIGAYLLYRFTKRHRFNANLVITLIGLMLILGFGSMAWHSYRSLPTLLLDEIPIYIFVIFAGYFLTKSLTQSHKHTILIVSLIAVMYYMIFTYTPGINFLNGLLKYVFAMLSFLVLNILTVRKFGSGYNFNLPLTIFTVAIVFRGIDLYVCTIFPIGTHFIWHLLIALVMYFGSIAILRLSLLSNTS